MHRPKFRADGPRHYSSRATARLWAAEMPIGDPFGGPAYGEKRDPVTIGAAFTATFAGAATVASVATVVSTIGIGLTVVGAVTGNKKLMKIGSIMGVVGGVTSLAAGAGVFGAEQAVIKGAEAATGAAAAGTAADTAARTMGAEEFVNAGMPSAGGGAAQSAFADSLAGTASGSIAPVAEQGLLTGLPGIPTTDMLAAQAAGGASSGSGLLTTSLVDSTTPVIADVSGASVQAAQVATPTAQTAGATTNYAAGTQPPAPVSTAATKAVSKFSLSSFLDSKWAPYGVMGLSNAYAAGQQMDYQKDLQKQRKTDRSAAERLWGQG